MANRPVLELLDGSAGPFELRIGDNLIGRDAACTVILDAAGVADVHARLTIDPGLAAWIENVRSPTGVLRNGQRIQGRERIGDGDELEIGTASVTIRGVTPLPAKAPNEQATMMSGDLPPEVKALIAKQQAMKAAPVAARPVAHPSMPLAVGAPVPAGTTATMDVDRNLMRSAVAQGAPRPMGSAAIAPPPVDAGVIVGTPEPAALEEDNRTMQMEAPDFSKLGLVLPTAAPPAAPSNRSTVMGLPAIAGTRPAPAPTPAPVAASPVAATHAPSASSGNPFDSGVHRPMMSDASPQPAAAHPMGGSPSPTPHAPSPQPPFGMDSTPPSVAAVPVAAAPAWSASPPAPVVVAPVVIAPTPSANLQAATAFMDAPVAASVPAPKPAQNTAGPQAGVSTAYIEGFSTGAIPAAYTPSGKSAHQLDHGLIASVMRSLGFMKQMFALAGQNKNLLKPVFYDLFLTTPVTIVLSILLVFVSSPGAVYGVLVLGTTVLYFTDYACNALTASLIHDQVTTGHAEMSTAMPRVKKALGGVLAFAAVSAVLDVASTYARERRDVLARILVDVLRRIWTTATYIIMPALVIEGVSFSAAFARSKKLMAQDPTGVGAGIVAMSITSYVVNIVVFALAYFALRFGSLIHPTVGAILFFLMVNLYWSVSGWLKISYSTCFYLWARECEQRNVQDPALAPAPLRAALLAD